MPDLSDPARDGLITIKHAACAAADLTRQLLIYAGRGQVNLAPLQLDPLVGESLGLLRAGAPQRLELRAELGSEEHWIDADARQVQQVVNNLLRNALEAHGEGAGSVVVRTRLEQLDAVELARYQHGAPAKPGRFVVLEVSDTGTGIDPARLSRIFEPFFTSKFAGRGLGLASVRGIVRSHNAALRVRSALGQGSSFEIAWPVAEPSATSPAPPRHASTLWKGSGQLLLVDDDPAVRRALARQLDQLGFVVTQAASGAEALELFRAKRSRFRLAVVDRIMPELSGDHLIQLFHELEPALPVVLVSGYSDRGPLRVDDRVAFVAKPMTLCDLQRAIAGLFEI
jgi:CheY-like chemotaxis protein